MSTEQNSVSDILEDNTYKFGFTTDVESETFAKGLDEDVVRAISKKKKEPGPRRRRPLRSQPCCAGET